MHEAYEFHLQGAYLYSSIGYYESDLQGLGSHRALPVRLVAEDGPEVADDVDDAEREAT